jgi:8-oxo-dGTP diphosphatase
MKTKKTKKTIEVVRAGIAVLLVNRGKVLLGKRRTEPNCGSYALPGGKPEFGENPEDTARREIREETGIILTGKLEQFYWVNNFNPESGTHFITLIYLAKSFKGTPKNAEPEKNEGWAWYSLNKLPHPLWPHLDVVLEKLAKKLANKHTPWSIKALSLDKWQGAVELRIKNQFFYLHDIFHENETDKKRMNHRIWLAKMLKKAMQQLV